MAPASSSSSPGLSRGACPALKRPPPYPHSSAPIELANGNGRGSIACLPRELRALAEAKVAEVERVERALAEVGRVDLAVAEVGRIELLGR